MQALEKTADAPGSGQKWRRKKVCKSCHWLRKIDCVGDGWDGKCCTLHLQHQPIPRDSRDRRLLCLLFKKEEEATVL